MTDHNNQRECQTFLPGMEPPRISGAGGVSVIDIDQFDGNLPEIPNTNWTTDNEIEIPRLLPSLQGDLIDEPIMPWGGMTRAKRMEDYVVGKKGQPFNGTFVFYVEDYRFTALEKYPNRPLVTSAPTLAELNFTIINRTPLWKVHQLIGLKRWISRYWQHNNRRILVDLYVPEKYMPENLLGVPRGWRAYATRGADCSIDHLKYAHSVAVEHAETDELVFLVYGGGKQVKQFCLDYGLTHCENERTRIARGEQLSYGELEPADAETAAGDS
jgi:hypothetical protein